MVKYIVLLLVLYGSEAFASPSADYRGSVSDGCRGEAPCTRSAASPPAPNSAEEFSRHVIESAVAAAVALSIKNYPTTTPAPMMIGFREEITSIVSAAVIQAMKDLTPPTLTNEEIVSIVGQCQRTVQNLTRIVEQLTVPTPSTTMTPVSTCVGEIASAVACQETVRNLTTIVAQLTASTTTPAPAPRCDCDGLCQLPVKNLTKTLAETTPTVAQQTCVSDGYEYSDVTGRCYKLHTESVQWPIANSTCREEGGLLAVINDREEKRVLSGIRQRISDVCYIGVFRDSAGHWMTVAGTDLETTAGFNVWAEKEPWSGEAWCYGMVYSDGSIASAAEASSGNFICEMSAA